MTNNHVLGKVLEKFVDYCQQDDTRRAVQGQLLDPMVTYVITRVWNYVLALFALLTCHLVLLTWLVAKISSLAHVLASH